MVLLRERRSAVFYEDPLTVAQLAFNRGGDGRGAYVGVALGCDTEAFYVDKLQVADAVDQTVYDFEGVPTLSGLYWYEIKKKNKKKEVKLHTNNLAVCTARSSPYWVSAGTRRRSTRAVARSTSSGTADRFVRVKGDGFDPQHFAVLDVKPKDRTTYVFQSDGTDWFDISNSNAIRVDVLADLAARVNDLSLKPGQRAVLAGKVFPGDRGTKVSLQRRVGTRWATVDTTRTRGGGAFDVSVKASKVGKMLLRLKVGPPNAGVRGNVSTSVKVTVTPRPQAAERKRWWRERWWGRHDEHRADIDVQCSGTHSGRRGHSHDGEARHPSRRQG